MGRRANTEVARPTPDGDRQVVPWIRWGGPVVLAIAVALHVAAYCFWPIYALQIDTLVYRFGGVRVLDGLDLYAIGMNGQTDDLLFTYTPFAAVFFAPLALITNPMAQSLSIIGFVVLLVYVTTRILRSFGLTANNGLWGLVALLVGLLSWVQPIRLSLQLGQINMLILAVVIADILAPGKRKWAGIGIGLVAGIKLTPVVFIVFLLLVGRVRAAIVASATLLVTLVVGFAILPSESQHYWIDGAFANTKRITRNPSIGTSVQSLLERLHYPAGLATVLGVVLMAASLAVAVLAYRRGYAALGVAIVGMASAAVSPFSWSHHWVWFAPLIVHLGYRAYVLGSRVSAWTMWVFCLLFADWLTSLTGQPPDSSILSLHPGGVWNEFVPSTYVFVLLVVLISTVVWLRKPSQAPQLSVEGTVLAAPVRP